MLDDLLKDYYGEIEALEMGEERKGETYTIKYVEGRKTYICADKTELIVYKPQEIFQKFCDARSKSISDETVFNRVNSQLVGVEAGSARHAYWTDVLAHMEKVYDKRKDELPPLAEKKPATPKGLFSNIKKGTQNA